MTYKTVKGRAISGRSLTLPSSTLELALRACYCCLNAIRMQLHLMLSPADYSL